MVHVVLSPVVSLVRFVSIMDALFSTSLFGLLVAPVCTLCASNEDMYCDTSPQATGSLVRLFPYTNGQIGPG